jgi:hypothetical protein
LNEASEKLEHPQYFIHFCSISSIEPRSTNHDILTS